jgi:type I restriction-modification system DNA methylase subunit
MTKEQAKEKVSLLVQKYQEAQKSGHLKGYTEADTKEGFIAPLFNALGWNMQEKSEVSNEETISGDRADYGFRLNNRPQFYVEAKSFKADIHDEKFARQAIKYSWNKGVTWAVLTDFKVIKVFNADFQSDKLFHSQFFDLSCDEFLEKFDQLWLLSKEAFQNGELNRKALESGKAIKRVSVTESLYKDLTECRKILTEALKRWNEAVPDDEIDEGVQKLLNRLVFIRVLEDREIEPHLLKNTIREWDAGNYEKDRPPLYAVMVEKFRELDVQYNSGLFEKHAFERWQEYDNETKKVINILYGKSGYYEYDFKVMPADVLGAVYENYLGYKLAQSKKGLTADKDAKKRKEHGIYYTPEFVVDYIIKNTLEPVLRKCRTVDDMMSIKVLDPACGSGSFLIKAVDAIYQYHYDHMSYRGSPTMMKLRIITQNIYGIDLDSQAVEIARLNLLINAVEEKILLPSLAQNIKNGNSLISGTDEELKKYFGKDWRDKKSFNWQEEFPEVFKQGGFDVVIGNPPYIDSEEMSKTQSEFRNYCLTTFTVAKGNWDLFCIFLEKGLSLIKNGGELGMIVPNKLISAKYADATRNLLSSYTISILADYSTISVFGASVYPVVIVVKKEKDKTGQLEVVINKGKDYPMYFTSRISPQKVLNDYKDGWAPLFETNKDLDFLNRIITQSPKLGSWAMFDITGSATVGEAYEIKKIIHEEKLSNNELKFINTGTIDRYKSLWGIKATRYIKDSYEKPVVTKADLKNISNKRYTQATSSKIIIGGMSKILESFLDIDEYYLSGKSTTIIMSTDKNKLKILLGILNSALLSRIYARMFSSLSLAGGFFRIGALQIKLLPINLPKDNIVQKKLITLVDKIIELNSKLNQTHKNSNEWEKLENEVKKTDNEINTEVYKLYGLTAGEIKTVENSI